VQVRSESSFLLVLLFVSEVEMSWLRFGRWKVIALPFSSFPISSFVLFRLFENLLFCEIVLMWSLEKACPYPFD